MHMAKGKELDFQMRQEKIDDSKELKKQKSNAAKNAAISGASAETVQRYGAANKEFIVAYSGKDNEAGKTLKKSLKSISQEKINSENAYRNIHQQAGFSAEVEETARENAKNIINGSGQRKIRTDDLGRVNDPLYDHVYIDKDGNIIEGSGAQMKFLGASEKDPEGLHNAERVAKKLLTDKNYQKYFDNDVKIEVPSDQYDAILDQTDKEIESLKKQLQKNEAEGNKAVSDNLRAKLQRAEKLKKLLVKSNLSTKEAVFARMHPELAAAKDVIVTSNQAGINAGKYAAFMGGSISIINNVVAVIKGEKDADDAVREVAIDTASSAATGYVTGFSGSVIQAVMKNSTNTGIRALSSTNLAGTLATAIVTSSKTLKLYFDGSIDGVQCLETLGQENTGLISSAVFSSLGVEAAKIVVGTAANQALAGAVGGMIGGLVGYALVAASYKVVLESTKEAKLAHEERIKIEEICRQDIEKQREYQKEVDEIVNQYFKEKYEVFHSALGQLAESIHNNDIEGLVASTNSMKAELGYNVTYGSMDEFDALMNGSANLKL